MKQITEHPGREQPFTAWLDGETVYFGRTRRELEEGLQEMERTEAERPPGRARDDRAAYARWWKRRRKLERRA